MPLQNLNPVDNFTVVETKIDAVIDDLNNNQIKWKVIPIGDWNMASLPLLTVAHGLNLFKIRSLSAIIFNDLSDSAHQIIHNDGSMISGGISSTAMNISINRVAGRLFDTSLYNLTPFNRGYITIGYVE